MTEREETEAERPAGVDHQPPPPYEPDRELITHLEKGQASDKGHKARIPDYRRE